ncbi:sensor histidine kinase [Christensenella tenuis]|uniref:histidine kinase n=1 Tax=Christensenella tenuis TaxID=2763033 RepID=A0ABR7EGC3_9FIRM|nr:sensor histidine kinase [Christensenella tenuis]MBC5648813.1 sensor histidine kinase [Christensenella tenuis]
MLSSILSFIRKRKGATHILFFVLVLFVLCSLGLFLGCELLVANSALFPDRHSFDTALDFIFFIYFAAQTGIIVFVCIKYIRPLYQSDCLIFETYDRIANSKGITRSGYSGNFYEVVDTVIRQHKDSWNRELSANLLRHKAELSQLQSQINPHFLYNTLESIRGLALMKNVPEIAEMLESLSQLFRNNTRKIGLLVPLSDEIKNVDNYILIQKFRFQDRFTFEKKIADGDRDLTKCLIPNFIIQPILENAITHGLESKPSGGKITLSIYSTQSRLLLQVSDNGSGIPDKKLRELISLLNSEKMADTADSIHVGIGIININQRIKMQYGNEYGLSIASTINVGTQVEITLPLQ